MQMFGTFFCATQYLHLAIIVQSCHLTVLYKAFVTVVDVVIVLFYL